MVLWVDSKIVSNERYEDTIICSATDLVNIDFDLVVIAVNKANVVSEIKDELTKIYKIPKEKIVWKLASERSIYEWINL